MTGHSPLTRRQALVRLNHCAVGLLALPTGTSRAFAAEATGWPPSLTRFIVPFPPGGPMDLLARTVADALVADGHKVVVENNAGGAGNIGIQLAMRGPADGSVLLFIPQGNITINPTLYPKLPFSWERDFRPVTTLAWTPNVLAVGPSVKAGNVGELIDFARKNPGKLSYASPGIGSSLHLIGELFRRKADIDIVHVPYKGTTPAMQDVAGGQVDLIFGALPTLRPFIDQGKLRALAVTTAERAQTLDQLPTLAESGLAGVDVPSWYGVMAPAAVPAELATRIQATMASILDKPAVRERLTSQGLVTVASTPASLKQRIDAETAQWATVIREANITAE